MSHRLEFSDAVKRQIFARAGGPRNLACENPKCRLPLRGKAFHYDHIIEEWEREDIEHGLRPPLTAEDGQLLCVPCHDLKTAMKSGERAHGKRIVKKAAKVESRWRPLPCGRNSGWKKPLGSRKAVKR